MISRVILLALVVLLVVMVIKRWTQPRVATKRPAPRVQSAAKCATCEAYVLDSAPEPCDRPDCPYR